MAKSDDGASEEKDDSSAFAFFSMMLAAICVIGVVCFSFGFIVRGCI